MSMPCHNTVTALTKSVSIRITRFGLIIKVFEVCDHFCGVAFCQWRFFSVTLIVSIA